MELIVKLLEWLDANLAKIALAFGLGYKIANENDDELKKKLLEEETKRKLVENELKVIKENADKSDIDIVNEAIKRSRGK